MKILKYINEIKERVKCIDKYISNPINHKDLNNPFASTLPKTYVWIEEDRNHRC